jgi:protein phosphatase
VTAPAPPTIRMISGGVTDKGRVRGHNEDSFLDAPQSSLWVVADGMGGHTAGDVASKMIVERLGKLQPKPDPAAFLDLVEDELYTVNEDLRKHAKERNVQLIGATVVALLGAKEYFMCGWAGDSRAYRYQGGELTQISRDHSTAQEMMDTGQFTADQLKQTKPQGNTITRAVGGEAKLYLDWVLSGYEPGTQFLLCSDGLTKEISDRRIAEELAKNLPPPQAAANLVKLALEAGGRDNVTALVVRAESTPA